MKLSKLSTTRLIAVVVFWIPLALATVFFAFVASNRFVSTTVVSVKDTGGTPAASGAIAALTGAGTSYSDVFYLQSYFRSADLLARVDEQLNLREHFSQREADFVFRLRSDATREEFLEYFRNRVELTHDDLTGLVTLKVQGFAPEFAQRLAQALVREGERFVNEAAQRIARDRVDFAQKEVERADEQVKKAKAALLAFQTRHKVLDVNNQAATTNTVTSSLQTNLAKLEADLKTAQAFMSEDSLQVRSLRSQISAIQSQLEAERRRSTQETAGGQLPAQAMEYQGLLAQVAFGEEVRKGALVAMEQARMDTARKLKSVVVIDPPSLPDDPTYPRRLYYWFTSLAVLAMLYAVVRLIAATIREHQD